MMAEACSPDILFEEIAISHLTCVQTNSYL